MTVVSGSESGEVGSWSGVMCVNVGDELVHMTVRVFNGRRRLPVPR